MRPNAVVAILAVGALMIGAFMLYATSDLFGSMNPDPYDREEGYSVTGTSEGSEVSGTALLTTINESGAYHNYLIDVSVDGVPPFSFLVPFGPDGHPSSYDLIGGGGPILDVYAISLEGRYITISVGELCTIAGFTVIGEGYELTGEIIE